MVPFEGGSPSRESPAVWRIKPDRVVAPSRGLYHFHKMSFYRTIFLRFPEVCVLSDQFKVSGGLFLDRFWYGPGELILSGLLGLGELLQKKNIVIILQESFGSV